MVARYSSYLKQDDMILCVILIYHFILGDIYFIFSTPLKVLEYSPESTGVLLGQY